MINLKTLVNMYQLEKLIKNIITKRTNPLALVILTHNTAATIDVISEIIERSGKKSVQTSTDDLLTYQNAIEFKFANETYIKETEEDTIILSDNTRILYALKHQYEDIAYTCADNDKNLIVVTEDINSIAFMPDDSEFYQIRKPKRVPLF